MEEDRKIGYGRIVAEGQQAVDLAAFQRLEAPVHSVRSDRPSDQTNEPTRWTDSQTTACCKREGWVGFQTSQISVAPSRAQHSWYEPVNWFTKEQEIWTVTTFTFAFTPPRMQSCQLISTWRQNVKLQVWNQPNFYHHSIALHNYYHWSHIGPYGPIMK